MSLNPKKSQAILMNKRKFDLTNLQLNADDKAIKSMSPVELLGITLDEKRNF